MAGCHVDAEKSVSEHVPNSPSHPEYTKHDVNQSARTGIKINEPSHRASQLNPVHPL